MDKANAITQFKDEYAFLSNFYPCAVEYEGVIYPSSEHAYMSAKSDSKIWKMRCTHGRANDVKKESYQVQLINGWDYKKLSVMHIVVANKFLNNSDLAAMLLGTGDRMLVEGNTWKDTYWGVDLYSGKGYNHLGSILMLVRSNLKQT